MTLKRYTFLNWLVSNALGPYALGEEGFFGIDALRDEDRQGLRNTVELLFGREGNNVRVIVTYNDVKAWLGILSEVGGLEKEISEEKALKALIDYFSSADNVRMMLTRIISSDELWNKEITGTPPKLVYLEFPENAEYYLRRDTVRNHLRKMEKITLGDIAVGLIGYYLTYTTSVYMDRGEKHLFIGLTPTAWLAISTPGEARVNYITSVRRVARTALQAEISLKTVPVYAVAKLMRAGGYRVEQTEGVGIEFVDIERPRQSQNFIVYRDIIYLDNYLVVFRRTRLYRVVEPLIELVTRASNNEDLVKLVNDVVDLTTTMADSADLCERTAEVVYAIKNSLERGVLAELSRDSNYAEYVAKIKDGLDRVRC